MTHIQVWQQLLVESKALVEKEPLLASYVYSCILNHDNLAASLSFVLANKLSDKVMSSTAIRELFEHAYEANPSCIGSASQDIMAVYERDPAIDSLLTVVLNLKGFQSIQVHRMANHYWHQNRKELAAFIQSRNSEKFGVDIHPACQIGKGVMFDHATGIVVGETAVIEDNVSLLQNVTLGGTGNEHGDRHPKVRTGVLIGAGAKVLGNIEIGEGSKVGAGSVVLKDVPAHSTAVGIPAKIVGSPKCTAPCQTMDQNFLTDNA